MQGESKNNVHTPVLLKEVLEGLALAPGDVVLDGTVGSAGHGKEMSACIGSTGTYIGVDQDSDALQRAKENLKDAPAQICLVEESFRNLDTVLDSLGFEQVDKILLDLGISSNQLETSGRGFTFQKDEPLLMTMKKSSEDGLTAGEIVNSFEEENLITILESYGEEKHAKRIAKGIVEAREEKEIKTTGELAEIIKTSVPLYYRRRKIHPATKTFQALRMTVNDEFKALEEALTKAWEKLSKGGRLAVISFHSIEDRTVKKFFKEKKRLLEADVLTKKPIFPGEEEKSLNPRSRSAKLRIAQRK